MRCWRPRWSARWSPRCWTARCSSAWPLHSRRPHDPTPSWCDLWAGFLAGRRAARAPGCRAAAARMTPLTLYVTCGWGFGLHGALLERLAAAQPPPARPRTLAGVTCGQGFWLGGAVPSRVAAFTAAAHTTLFTSDHSALGFCSAPDMGKTGQSARTGYSLDRLLKSAMSLCKQVSHLS